MRSTLNRDAMSMKNLITRILVPTDFSRSLKLALKYAKRPGASIRRIAAT